MARGRWNGTPTPAGNLPSTGDIGDRTDDNAGIIPVGNSGEDGEIGDAEDGAVPDQSFEGAQPAGDHDSADRLLEEAKVRDVPAEPAKPTGVRKLTRKVTLVPPASFPYAGPIVQDPTLWVIYGESGQRIDGFLAQGAARKFMDEEGYFE